MGRSRLPLLENIAVAAASESICFPAACSPSYLEVIVNVQAGGAKVEGAGYVRDDAFALAPLLWHPHPHVPVPQLVGRRPLALQLVLRKEAARV